MAKGKKPKKQPTIKTTPKRLIRAPEPSVNLIDDIKVATEILRNQRKAESAEFEYALIVTSKSDEVEDINDEFSREFQFCEQAKRAAKEVLPKLKELGIPTAIPKTFKGLMVKDERQMAKIRDVLRSKKDSIDKSEKMKKLRELKKVGKKIQEEVLRKRSKDKKEFLEKVKKRPVSELFED